MLAYQIAAQVTDGRRTRCRDHRAAAARGGRAGFTLVEIMIVVVLLGILAALVIPAFTNASEPAKEGVLRDQLRLLRMQVELYAGHHRGVPPGYPGGDTGVAPTAAAFEAQLTQYTSEAGATNATYAPGTPLAPYTDRIPANPFNGLTSVRVLGDGDTIPAADGQTYGWFFKPATRQLVANTPGADAAGHAYTSY